MITISHITIINSVQDEADHPRHFTNKKAA